jgi:hypothetical protein
LEFLAARLVGELKSSRCEECSALRQCFAATVRNSIYFGSLAIAVQGAGSIDMPKSRNSIQVVWGTLLFIAGIGVFFRIPQVMPEIKKIEYFSSAIFFIQFCFYLIGILLIGGGAKKIYHNYSSSEAGTPADIHDKK